MDASTVKSALEENPTILLTTVGGSMRPMLRERRDAVVISRITRPVKVNDVILFTSLREGYILHRVIRAEKDGIIKTRGDNCLRGERVSPDRVIGVLDGFYRDDKYVDCRTSRGYKLYVFCVRAFHYPHSAVKGVRILLSKLKKRLTGKNDNTI